MAQDLNTLFAELKNLIIPYEQYFTPCNMSESRYELWQKKDIIAYGRKRNEIYFAGLIIQSNYVGFYFMPIYGEPSMKEALKPDLLKLLKGKSCFHIKKLDENLKSQIRDLLEYGLESYKKLGWL